MMSLGIGRPALLSLSKVIEENKKEYYTTLGKAQTSNEVTDWVRYFCHTALEAQKYAEKMVGFVVMRVKFFDELGDRINPRQEKALQRMFEAGPEGFEGGMTAKKYISLTGASKATATRDLQELLELDALIRVGAGRSTRYDLNV